MKTVTILTIARSGSSLLSGILQRLGVDMGSKNDMILGKHLNKYGSHENQDFISLSVNLLFDVGILLDFPKRLENYEEKMQVVAENYRHQFRELIAQHSSELWGFKEASLIYYLPYLESELENPYYIHLIRDYDSTANSLLDMVSSKHWKHEYREKMKFFSLGKRIHLILRIARILLETRKTKNRDSFREIVIDAHKRIQSFLNDKSHFTIRLEQLVEDPVQIITKLVDFLEIIPTIDQIDEAINFVHPELLTE